MRISVIGCGYLGAVHAAALADLGFNVVGVDVARLRVEALNAGESPFHEPGFDHLLASGLGSGRLRFTTDLAEVADRAQVHFVCVGTPPRPGEPAADVSQIDAVIQSLAPMLTAGAVVVGKSTVPVGTARRLREQLRRTAPAGTAVELAWNPEFLREGHGVQDTLHPDRLVFGLAEGDAVSEELLRRVYAATIGDGTPVINTSLETAELVKTAANGFLATKISYINAMAELCDAVGADVTTLADALGLDARIGRAFLNAGLGFGGGCLPKDIRAFTARAAELGLTEALGILREVDDVNERQRERVVDLAASMLGDHLPGRRVAVLGAAFKPNSDDIRDSPALNVAGRLHLRGCAVTVYDPAARANCERLWPTLQYADTMADAVRSAEVVLVLTEWDEFRKADPHLLAELVDERRILDGRNCLDPDAWRAAGWTYRGLGRP